MKPKGNEWSLGATGLHTAAAPGMATAGYRAETKKKKGSSREKHKQREKSELYLQ